jgi:S1-C subfamily serine protease
VGDVITNINGQRVLEAVDVDLNIWGLFIGDTCTLEIVREARTRTVIFKIVELSRA